MPKARPTRSAAFLTGFATVGKLWRVKRTVIQRIALGVLAAAVLIGTGYSNYCRAAAGIGDFRALRQASEHALQTSQLNDPCSLGYYPPSARPILMPLAWLDLRPAAAVWWALMVLLYGLCLYLLVSHVLPGSRDRLWIAGLSLVVALPWLIADLNVGNISSLVLASVVAGYVLARKGRPVAAGFAVAAGVSLKLIPVFLIVFFVIKRRWKAAACSLVATAAVAAVPGVLIFGGKDFAGSWTTWRREAVHIRTPQYTILEAQRSTHMNQSWPNVLVRLLHGVDTGHSKHPFRVNVADLPRERVLVLYYAFAALSLGLWVFLIWPRRGDPPAVEALHFATVPLVMLWFSPHVMSYYLSIAMPAMAVFVWALVEKPAGLVGVRKWLIVLALVYWAGCASMASDYLRAIGSYQMVILVLAAATFVIAQRMRVAAGASDQPTDSMAGSAGGS